MILAFLTREPSVFTIPKASTVAHVEENAGAGDLTLDASDIAAIDAAFPVGRAGTAGDLVIARPASIKALAIERARALGAGDVRVVDARAGRPLTRAHARIIRTRRFCQLGLRRRRMRAPPPIRAPCCRRAQHRVRRGAVRDTAGAATAAARARFELRVVARLPPRACANACSKASRARSTHAAGARVTAIACDTKPIAERAFAARAGLGWIGKHTNLISPSLGSFVFLGEVITTLELEPDAPLRKTCGACARCVAGCPTGALRGDYTIDATRCIADLTQRTDPDSARDAPLDWRLGLGLRYLPGRLSPDRQGRQRAGPRHSFRLDGTVAAPSLTELLQLRSGEFKRRYARTAMGWRGAAVLRRNAAIGLGNALDRSAIPALRTALAGDPHPMVRGAAAWALGRIGAPHAQSKPYVNAPSPKPTPPSKRRLQPHCHEHVRQMRRPS